MAQTDKRMLSDSARAEIDKWLAQYPPEWKQAAVISALKVVQEENGGWLTEPLMDAVAGYLDMPPIAVYEVATFYTMFNLKPVGRHVINVCTNVSCMLCGSEEIIKHMEQRLGITLGETTTDGRFTLKEAECLAACAGAPMFYIGDTFYENLTPQKIDKLLDSLE
jgi:NADH-quinone oxidoreductase subunit E